MDADFPDEMTESIERFFREVHPKLIPGQDVYPEVFETALFFPLQRQRELARMMQIARSISPKTVMEIGADKGGGLYHWCNSLPTVKNVIACEIRGTPYGGIFEDGFPITSFLWIEGPSRDASLLGLVKTYLKTETIDCLFIDGCKLTMLEDFDAYLPTMSKGGIVFIHDVQDDYPAQTFNALRNRGYRTELILDKSEASEAVAREKAGEVTKSPWDGWLKYWIGRSCGVGVVYV